MPRCSCSLQLLSNLARHRPHNFIITEPLTVLSNIWISECHNVLFLIMPNHGWTMVIDTHKSSRNVSSNLLGLINRQHIQPIQLPSLKNMYRAACSMYHEERSAMEISNWFASLNKLVQDLNWNRSKILNTNQSYYFILYHIMSYYIILYHIISYYIILYHIVLAGFSSCSYI